MALDLSNSCNLEQLASKGLNERSNTFAEVAVIVLVDVDVVVDNVVVVAVFAAVVTLVAVVVILVSWIVVYFMMLVDESRTNHLQVTQS